MIGFSNHHGFQLELERRYNNGIGFQVFWVTGNTLWSGSGVDSNTVLDTNQFLPGAVPAEVSARNAFINYGRDTGTPKNQKRWKFRRCPKQDRWRMASRWTRELGHQLLVITYDHLSQRQSD
jgi:hypothetical protein